MSTAWSRSIIKSWRRLMDNFIYGYAVPGVITVLEILVIVVTLLV